jgi:hypothetical protein
MVSIDEDDIDDGSGSDDSHEHYVPRHSFKRVEHVPDEAISVMRDRHLQSTFSTVPVPASPLKKKNTVILTADVSTEGANQKITVWAFSDVRDRFAYILVGSARIALEIS